MSSSRAPDGATVAGNIRAEMARRQFSRRDLAHLLDVSYPYVVRRLRGEISFDVGELLAIAKWLDIEPTRLLAGTHDARIAS